MNLFKMSLASLEFAEVGPVLSCILLNCNVVQSLFLCLQLTSVALSGDSAGNFQMLGQFALSTKKLSHGHK